MTGNSGASIQSQAAKLAAPLRPPRQLRRRSVESGGDGGGDSPRARDALLGELGLQREGSPAIPEEPERLTDELLDGFDALPQRPALAPGKKTDDIEAPQYADDGGGGAGRHATGSGGSAGTRKAFSQPKAGGGRGGAGGVNNSGSQAAASLQGGPAAPRKQLPLRAGGARERYSSGWSLYRGAGLCAAFGVPVVLLAVLWLLLVLAQVRKLEVTCGQTATENIVRTEFCHCAFKGAQRGCCWCWPR